VFNLRCLWKRIVALETQRRRKLDQEVGVGRTVGVMATRAFAVLCRLVFDLEVGEKVSMTGKTDLRLRALHGLGELAHVTLGALLLLVRRVGEEPWGKGPLRIGARRPVRRQRLAVLVVLHPGGIGRARDRDAVEEEGEPFLLGSSGAAKERGECKK